MMFTMPLDEEWDCDRVIKPPPRSVLVSLAPLGARTPLQEGLLSLLVRISHAHGVNVRQLIALVMGEADSSIPTLTGASFFRSHAGTINGLGRYAEMFTRALSQLTGGVSLGPATLLPWKAVFPFNGQGLLAAKPKWCPDCLSQQRIQDGMAWHPLAWSFEAYRLCPQHRCALEDSCARCGKAQPFIPCYPDLSFCQHCGGFLGGQRTIGEVSESELWLSRAVGDLVQHQGQPGFAPTVEQFRYYLQEQVNQATQGSRAEFSRQLGLNARALNGWLSKGERPSFSQFLVICYGLNVMPSEVFSVPPSVAPRRGLRSADGFMTRKSSARPTASELARIERRLQKMVDERLGWSVRRIAKELSVGASLLKYRFPEFCARLSQIHRDTTAARSFEYQQRQVERVAEIVEEIRASGVYPSGRKVNERLRREKMSLLQPHLAAAYRELMQRSGWPG